MSRLAAEGRPGPPSGRPRPAARPAAGRAGDGPRSRSTRLNDGTLPSPLPPDPPAAPSPVPDGMLAGLRDGSGRGSAQTARGCLVPLLALLVCVVLVAMASSGDDDDGGGGSQAPAVGGGPVAMTPPIAPPVPAAPLAPAPIEGAVGLPVPGPGNVPLVPARIVLVIDQGRATAARDRSDRRHRDLRAFGRWLADNHRPETRVIVGRSGAGPARFGPPITAEALAAGRTRSGDRGHAPGVRGLTRTVTIHVSARARAGLPSPSRVVRIVPARGARLPDATADPTGPVVVDVDVAKRNTIAATAARAVMQASRQREQAR